MDMVGKEIGYYRVIKHLGDGGTSQIYLGKHIFSGDEAALKVLFPEHIRNSEIIKRFESDVRALKSLEHDHVIPVLDFSTDNPETYFIVMKYIPHGDFSVLIQTYQEQGLLMPVARWLPIMKQVAGALDYVHSRNIIHRDVKPQNILIAGDDHAYLTDFGLMLDIVQGSVGMAFGTPRYIPPEQVQASQTARPQSDIYSLCVVLYELLTGFELFEGKDLLQKALDHIHTSPVPPRELNQHIPESVEKEILVSLSKRPENRHDSAMALILAIEDAFGGVTGIQEFDSAMAEKYEQSAKTD